LTREADPLPRVELGRFGRVLGAVGGAMILAMMAVTTVDVFARYVFGRPLWGAFEVTEILMGLVIFAGQSLAAGGREHIVVNLVEARLSPAQRRWQAACGDLIAAAVAALIAWRVWERGLGLARVGETTLQLGVPRGWVALAMAALMSCAAVVFALSAAAAARAATARRAT
jgi:TRAP-type C4-dicarboxylate transport system permease small subunit